MSTVSQTSSNSFSSDFLAAVNPQSKTAATESSMEMTQNRFLKLLTTQLQNQDPLNPMDNAQMTSQMAQINTVNGIEKLNVTLQKMMSNSTDAQSMQASSMLGRTVLVAGDSLRLVNSDGKQLASAGGIQLSGPADSVKISITDANGLVVRTMDLGALEQGVHDFSWNGMTDAGVAAASGTYTFSATAIQGANKVTADKLQESLVTGIVRNQNDLGLEVADASGQKNRIAVADVRQIY